jgi:acyl-CoA synthetase (NDP forming)
MTTDADTRRAGLRVLLEPRSVAIIGASTDPTRIGGRVLSYLLKGGYGGRIVPVNPNRAEVQGVPAVPTLAEAGPVELAVVALPAAEALDAVADCAAQGVRACIVFSSGFAEAGPEGAELERRMAEIARRSGMHILGPNCLGLFTPHAAFWGTFSNTLDRGFPAPGGLSIVSQSGAFGTHLSYLATRRGLGIRHWISTGNECDVQAAEALAFVAEDPGTRTILLYLEGVRDGAALIAALKAARAAGKPVIVVKVGRSAVGAAAAASHTAALAGGDAVYDAVFRDCGAWRAPSAEEAIDVAELCMAGRFPVGRRLGVVTISGGGGILIADCAAEAGLDLPEMPADAQAELRAALPFCTPRNPVDMTAQAFNRMDLFERNLDVIMSRGGYDAVIAFLTTVPGSAAIVPALKGALRSVRARHPDLPVILSMLVEPELERAYAAEGYTVIADANRAVRATAALAGFAESFRRPQRPNVPAPAPVALPASASEHDALELMRAAGLAVVATRLCPDADAAVAAQRAFCGPVVLKIVSPDIPHKTEIGGVLLGLEAPAEVAAGFATLMANAAVRAPGARIDGVLVAPMVTGHVEAIVGVENDPAFGPVVMVGLGGLFAEVLGDATFALAPLDRDEALAMVGRLRGRALMEGARGRPPADVEALADLVAAVSRWALAAGPALGALDLNPVAVLPQGQGCLVLDASLATRAGQGA